MRKNMLQDPDKRKVPKSISLPRYMWDIVESTSVSRSIFIETLIREKMDKKEREKKMETMLS